MNRLFRLDVVIAVVLFLLAVPFMDEIALACGYPLRLMATRISVGVLRLFGCAVVCDGTTIQAGAGDIALTDACSGVSELVGLLFVGYLMTRARQRNLGWTFFAWAFAVPSVILSNALRLIVLVALYRCWGACVLSGGWHVGLGWFQLVVALATLFGLNELIRRLS